MNSQSSWRCAILTPPGEHFRTIAQALIDALGDLSIHSVWIGGIGGAPEAGEETELNRTTPVILNLRVADLVIVDITGDNPNIMYELGIAHALRKYVLIIDREISGGANVRHRFPASLEGFLVFQYDDRDLSPLIRYARLWALERISVPSHEVAHGS